jgi:hypothetical protein
MLFTFSDVIVIVMIVTVIVFTAVKMREKSDKDPF